MVTEKDNTVPAKDQLTADARIRGEGEGHPKILFLGNSVTLHGPKADIGWHGDWGMAASSPEKDYVHLTVNAIREKHPDAAWRLCQLADWEREFWRGEEILSDFADIREWQPDVIFSVILGANTPAETLKEHDFAKSYAEMLRYFDKSGTAELIATTNFWASPEKDAAVAKAAAEVGATLIDLNDLGATDAMMAFGLFEHSGVAMHPGDLGMQEISNRLLNTVKTI